MGRLLPEVQMGVCQFQVDNNTVNQYTNFDIQWAIWCQNPLWKYSLQILANCRGTHEVQFNEYAHSFPTAKPVFTSSETSAVAGTHSPLLTSDGMTDTHIAVEFTHCAHCLSAERHRVESLVIFLTSQFSWPRLFVLHPELFCWTIPEISSLDSLRLVFNMLLTLHSKFLQNNPFFTVGLLQVACSYSAILPSLVTAAVTLILFFKISGRNPELTIN
jgi:hypothetical protein